MTGDAWMPGPSRDYLDGPVESLHWNQRRYRPSTVRLLADRPDFDTRFMRISAGQAMPKHSHGESELTLVLRGRFVDDGGHYGRGDVAAADHETTHASVVDSDEDCYCLAKTQGPLKLAVPPGKLLNPFVRY